MISRKIVPPQGLLGKYQKIIDATDPIRSLGKVVDIVGKTIYSRGPDVRLGELCNIEKVEDEKYILAEVVGFRGELVVLSPLENIQGVYPGSRVLSTGAPPRVHLGDELLGRVLDGLGRPLDNRGKIITDHVRELENSPPNPVERPLIRDALPVGIKAIDGFLTLGQGQRIGIFAGSGVGKSTLLGMAARYSTADVNVIGLIGERGREVGEFLSKDLGEAGMRKSVVVVASSNESAMQRVHAAYLATTIAEYFRDQGKNVLLMMDSVTRLAMAQREVGLSAGEPPTTRGYPPSVFSMMPQLLERAGNSPKGSITGIYTVLVDGDDMNEPIADALRGILDGHIVLSRRLANRGHYPSIEVTESISRLMNSVLTKEQAKMAASLKALLSIYQENEEIINLGAYVRGSNPSIDQAIQMYEPIKKLLAQDMDEYVSFEETLAELKRLYQQTQAAPTQTAAGRRALRAVG